MNDPKVIVALDYDNLADALALRTKLTQAHVDSKWVKRCLLYLVLILSVSCINEVFLCFWI